MTSPARYSLPKDRFRIAELEEQQKTLEARLTNLSDVRARTLEQFKASQEVVTMARELRGMLDEGYSALQLVEFMEQWLDRLDRKPSNPARES